MTALRKLSFAGVGVLCLAFASCGGGTDGPTVIPTPDPTPVPPMVITEGSFTLPYSSEIIISGRREFTTSSSGTLETTVDWTDASNSVDVILARGICTFDQLNADQCDLASFTRGTEPKPRRVALAGQPAGSYTLIIGNEGPGDESVSYQIVLSAAATSASASASASGRARGLAGPPRSGQPYGPPRP